MLVVTALKMYDLLVCSDGEGSFLTLQMTKPWMTVVSRMFFYAGFAVVVMAVINVLTGLALATPWWVHLLVFTLYFILGFVIQMVIVYVAAIICMFVWMLFFGIKERLFKS